MTGPSGGETVAVGAGEMAPHLLVARAEQAGDEIVLHDVGTGRQWTAAELLDSVRRLASALGRSGVGAGEVVVSMLPDQGASIRTWLASSFVGAIEAAVNPSYRGSLLRAIFELVRPAALVVTADVLDDLDPDVLALAGRVLVWDDDGDGPSRGERTGMLPLGPLMAAEPDVTVPPAAQAGDTAAIVFTSGTTGPSKGVIVTWASVYQLVSFLPADAYGAGAGGGALYCPLPMFHLAGKSNFTNAMARRARYVYRERFSASAFLGDVRATGSTTATVVGPMLSFLAATPEHPDDADNPLRMMVCGPMVPGIDQLKVRFGVDVATCYGMTEIGSVLTTGTDHGPWNSCGRVRRSYPWPEVRIVDSEGADVAPGTVGELVVRTANTEAFSPGYVDDPAATTAAWRGGWFHSGDAMRADDEGNFYLVDRYSDTIRRRGENVSSFELEAIVGSHAAVAECAAVAVPGAHGDDDIVVFVIAEPSVATTEPALAGWVAERVPAHMRPSRFAFVSDFPRNATSLRVKKYELRRMARDLSGGTSSSLT